MVSFSEWDKGMRSISTFPEVNYIAWGTQLLYFAFSTELQVYIQKHLLFVHLILIENSRLFIYQYSKVALK